MPRKNKKAREGAHRGQKVKRAGRYRGTTAPNSLQDQGRGHLPRPDRGGGMAKGGEIVNA